MYKVVSLFSGCGGADQGILGDFKYNKRYYESLPFELVYATDIDQKALNSHRENFDCENVVCKDICETESNEIPECDIVIGGFPCQSFSTVNPNKDPFDERANLYKQMARVIKEKQPKVFIAENVKGLMTLHKGKIFEQVIETFEEAGYITYSKLFNAADYGVPQKRERVIIVGIRNDLNKKAEYKWPIETNINNWVPLSVAVPKLDIEDRKYYFSERAVQGMKNAKNNMKRGLFQDLDQPCLTITSHLAKVSLNSRDPVLLVNPEKELYRRFTPIEAARIQSFPDEFKFAGSETDAYRQIGNAIPPVMFWHIANSVKEYLENVDTQSKEQIILNISSVEEMKKLGSLEQVKTILETIIYPMKIEVDSCDELFSYITLLKKQWGSLQTDRYFKNEECKYIFCLTEVDGKRRNRYIGLTESLYYNKDAAQKWYKNILKKIHPDTSTHAKANEAFIELKKLYDNIIESFEV